MYSGRSTTNPPMMRPRNSDARQVGKFFRDAREPLNHVVLDNQKEIFNSFSGEKKEKELAILKKVCKAYFAYYDDDKYIKDTHGYVMCCEIGGTCIQPFYMQIWFFVACGGVLLLLLIIGIVLGVFICRRRKGKSGGSNGGGQSGKGVEAGGKKNKK